MMHKLYDAKAIAARPLHGAVPAPIGNGIAATPETRPQNGAERTQVRSAG